MKDHCTFFFEYVFGIYIGDCCEAHDEGCNTYEFYALLRDKLSPLVFNHEIAFLIATGGAIGCWVKYTKKAFSQDVKL